MTNEPQRGYSATAYQMGRAAHASGEQFEHSASDSWKAGYKHAERASGTGMMVDVIIAGNDPDAPPVRSQRINYNSERARAWLASTTRWALSTGHTVHIGTVTQ